MSNQEPTVCDACLEEVSPSITMFEYAYDIICKRCWDDIGDMHDDHFDDDVDSEIYRHLDYEDPADLYADTQFDFYDNDPSPYSGTYSEE